MLKILKCDFYRFGKNKLLYGIMVFVCLLAFALTMLIRQDIRLGISVFGNLTAFKGIDDIVRIGLKYEKGLGLLIAIIISVFIGQEYLWKTWQHKWVIVKSRTNIYLSKMFLSVVISAVIFLSFEILVLLCSGQINGILTQEYVTMLFGGTFTYAALGAVLCMLSMLIKNNIASIIISLGYVLLSETVITILKSISGFSDISVKIGDWIVRHSIYGMSLRISGAISPEIILPVLLNSMIIIALSTAIGIFVFRKYEI